MKEALFCAEFGQSLPYVLNGRVSLERVAFTGRAASSEEKNKTKNTSFNSVFQSPCCVRGRRRLCFVPVEILPLCGAVLQGPRCFFLSIEQPILNTQGSLPKTDLT